VRLLSLHIENFGTLSDVDMDFNAGMNVILHENGWGKSTLAEFIRAMFYGIEGSRKKEFMENDRTRFQPWNGKYFGGEITFEVGGKQYKVERNFADKDKDMTFKLYDMTTMLESGDYSENLGEELFGVDSESFRRTCFVGNEGLRFNGINSTIGARVSSLEQSGDLENYDAADKRMNEFLSAYSPRRKTGELAKLKSEISELKINLKKKDSVRDRIEEIKENRSKVEESLQKLREEQDKVMELQKKNADAKHIHVKLETLNNIKEDVKNRKLNLERHLEALPEEIPTHDMIDEADRRIQEYAELSGQKKSFLEKNDSGRISRLESFFANGVPNLSEIDSAIEDWNNIQNLIQKNETLEVLIETEEERIASGKAEMEHRNAESNSKKSLLLLAMWICFAAGAGFVAGYIFTKIVILQILGVIAGIAGIAALVMRNMVGGTETQDSQIDSRQIQRYKQNIQANSSDIKNMEAKVKDFLARFEVPYSRLDAESILYDIKGKTREFMELKKDEAYGNTQKENINLRFSEVSGELIALLGRMGIIYESLSDVDLSQIRRQLSDLSRSINAYEIEVAEVQKSEEKLREYEEKNQELTKVDFHMKDRYLENLYMETQSLGENNEDEYSVRLKRLSSELSEKQDLISRYDRELESAYEESDELVESEEKLQELEAEYAELADRYDIVEKTQSYLKEAKELFIAKYMSPIKDSFDRYYELISGTEDNFRIDANVNLARKEEGAYHDIQAQSEGYGDAIGISMRLALLDTMYEKEKPVIILDDPFAGMDESKLAGTRRLLDAVSQHYQILYMTCHESRIM
jgi:uncharacterized protein YhaN